MLFVLKGMITSSLLKRLSGQYDETLIQRLNLERQGVTEIRGLSNCKSLVDLSLGCNELTSLSGLDSLTALKRLDVSYNRLRKLEGLEVLSETLVFLDLRGNRIEDIGDVHIFVDFGQLRTLYLRGPDGEDANPCCNHASYPQVVLKTMPLLQVLDGAMVQLLEACADLEHQMATMKANPDACNTPPTEPWLDGAELNAIEDATNQLSSQSVLALQKQQRAAETVQGQLSTECSHLLTKSTAAIQKAALA